MSSVTIRSVAEGAGVSTASVSRILNSVPGYRYDADTQRRVREVAAQLGYRPHSTASLMRARRTHLIGIVAQRFSNEYSALLRDALVQKLQQHAPYKPMFVDPVVFKNEGSGHTLGFELLEGLFWTLPARDDGLLRAILSRPGRRPEVVSINRQFSCDLPVSGVMVNGLTASQRATEHLLAMGHRRIAILYRAPRRSSVRFEGYRSALKKWSVASDERLCLALTDEYETDSYLNNGYVLARRLLEGDIGSTPTAIMCHNDEVAAGVLRAAYELKVQVPDDLSVVGFGVGRASRFTVPPLSSVEQPVQEIAEAAVALMLERLESSNGSGLREKQLACSFVERGSCAPPG